ncbi:CDPK-related protein kinase [Glycine max]|nr:CDPK-related protein kinase [Glycine max]
MKTYMRSSSLRKAALRVQPSKTGSISLENINKVGYHFNVSCMKIIPLLDSTSFSHSYFGQALMKYATDAMNESCILDFLSSVILPCSFVHQLEALDRWEQHTRCAYELFDKDGNKAIVIEQIASELGLGPSILVHVVLHDWICHTDGKLSFLGLVKFKAKALWIC